MQNFEKYKKLSTSKRLLISLGCIPVNLFWVLGMLYSGEFRNGWAVYLFLIIASVIYIIVFRYISFRGKRYLFNSNQQLLHNRLLFIPLYPLLYVWFLEEKIIELKNKEK